MRQLIRADGTTQDLPALQTIDALHKLIGADTCDTVRMRHMGHPDHVVDHDNGNGMDNRRMNLRWATHSQNAANRKKQGVHSEFRGVTLDIRKCLKPWLAQITKDYKHINLGAFEDELVAAAAYDLAARKLHGKFARLNLDLLYLQKDVHGAWVPAIEGARQ